MKNGTRFSPLTLIDNSEAEDDPAAYVPYRPESEGPGGGDPVKSLFYVFLTISISCATAAVVSGSYAVWLARQQAARQALTDVNDLLRSCQDRMARLESDVQRLPDRRA